IRGTATNQDGRSNGLTAPSKRAQIAVIEEAFRRAGASPADAQAFEAHGTGTSLGDPIEVGALTDVLRRTKRDVTAPVALGSVKTNIGHAEASAGIASLIKMALAAAHRKIPASL